MTTKQKLTDVNHGEGAAADRVARALAVLLIVAGVIVFFGALAMVLPPETMLTGVLALAFIALAVGGYLKSRI